MAKMDGNEKIGGTLPEELRNLITRKLHVRRREQLRLYAASNKFAYSELRREVMAEVSARRFGRALTSIPLATFGEIVDTATAITRSWPGIVWECITSLLNKAKVTSCNADELNAIVDGLAWAKEQQPFTYAYIAPDKFMDLFYREVSRYGVELGDSKKSLDSQLKLNSAAAACYILNTARWAREEISIAIEEYVMAQRTNNTNLAPPTIGDNHSVPCSAVNIDSPASAAVDQCEIFCNMNNLTFDELSMSFVGDKADSGLGSNNMLEISARNQSRRVALGEFDLVDRRNGSLNSQAAILIGMAGEKIPPINPANSTKMTRLRKVLRTKLGIKNDPFDCSSKRGWVPHFQIVDLRGAADVRAREEAERKSFPWNG